MEGAKTIDEMPCELRRMYAELRKTFTELNKHRKYKVIYDLPETDEELLAVQEVFGLAYTELAISVIKRKFKNPEDRIKLYDLLLNLKKEEGFI